MMETDFKFCKKPKKLCACLERNNFEPILTLQSTKFTYSEATSPAASDQNCSLLW